MLIELPEDPVTLDELRWREDAARQAAEAAAEMKRLAVIAWLEGGVERYRSYIDADAALSAARVAHADAIYARQEFERRARLAVR